MLGQRKEKHTSRIKGVRHVPWLLLVLVNLTHAAVFPPTHAVPGGIAVVALNEPAVDVVKYGGRRIMFVKDADTWYAMVGIDLSTPQGDYIITANPAGPIPTTESFTVHPFHYDVTQSTPPTPAAIAHSDDLDLSWRDELDARFPFILPMQTQSKANTHFGKRYIQGDLATSPIDYEQLSCKSKVNIVRAPAAGVVSQIIVRDEVTRTVVLDHGMGLHTLLAPVSKTVVDQGDAVERGAELGFLDAGESQTNLLGWKVMLNGVAVNPWLLTKP